MLVSKQVMFPILSLLYSIGGRSVEDSIWTRTCSELFTCHGREQAMNAHSTFFSIGTCVVTASSRAESKVEGEWDIELSTTHNRKE